MVHRFLAPESTCRLPLYHWLHSRQKYVEMTVFLRSEMSKRFLYQSVATTRQVWRAIIRSSLVLMTLTVTDSPFLEITAALEAFSCGSSAIPRKSKSAQIRARIIA